MATNDNFYEVVMPKLGLIMTEAMLVEWHKKDQEWVDQGELLFSLESEKTIIDIESPASGYLQVLVQAEETVPVLAPVALITDEKAGSIQAPAKAAPAASQEQAASQPVEAATTVSHNTGLRASPKARSLARERNLSLAGITGTGPRGMVVAADLSNALEDRGQVKATPVARKMAADFQLDLSQIKGTGPGGRVTREDIASSVRELVGGKTVVTQKSTPAAHLNGLRAIIAERLAESWNQRPQVTLNSQMDASALVKAREERKTSGEKISYNAYLVKASALALVEFPNLNVSLTPDGYHQRSEINVGVAVDTDRGLMVPVLKNAQSQSILALNDQLLDLVERTLAGRLLPEEYSGGSFTVTNLGGLGVDSFSPLINPPESAILGVGRIVDQPYIEEGELRNRKALTLSLSFDHRVVDGAPAAQFLAKIVALLQDPAQLD